MIDQPQTPIQPTVVRLMPLRDVLASVGLSQASVYRLMAAGEFPKPCKVGTASRWVSSEIEAWISDRVAERQQQRVA